MKARTVRFDALPYDTLRDAVSYISANLRDSDIAEIRATSDGMPEDIVLASVLASDIGWVMLDRTGLPVGLLGAAAHGVAGVGVPWMVGTDGVTPEAITLIRQTREHVDQMHELFPVLTNHIDARNDLSLDWLLWVGFDLIDAKADYGPEGRLFLQFMKAR